MANSPSIVLASLSDDQLKKSIDSLVTHVDEAMKKMVQSTNNAVGEMEAKLKSLGNLKIDTGGSNDGGTGRRTQQHEKLTKAVNDASEAVSKETQKLQDLQQSLSGASDREQNFISQKERAANTISKENELLQRQEQELANLKSQQSSFVGTNQQTTASIDKQRESVANLKNEVKYWQSVVSQMQSGDKKLRFNSLWLGDTTSKQGHDILDVANKLYSIMQKLGMETEKGSASTSQAVRAAEELAKYYKISREEAEKLILSVQESPLARGKYTTHYDTRFGLDNLTMQQKTIDDFALRKELAQGKLTFETDNLTLANKRLEESEKAVASASSQRSQLDSQIAAKEKEIAETKGRIATATKEQTEAEKNASQAAKEKANIQSQVANQEKQVAEAKKQLTTATQQHTDAETKSSRAAKEKTMTLDQQASAINTAIQSEKKYTDEIIRQANAVRENKAFKEEGFVRIGNDVFYNNAFKQWKNVASVEEQILQVNREREIAQQRIVLQEQREKQEKIEAAQAAQQQLGVEQQITKEYEKRRSYKAPQTSINESFRRMTARTIGVDTSEISSTSTQIAKMTNYVKQLEQAYSKLTDTGRRSPFGVQLREEMQMVSRTVQKLHSEMSRPINLKSVMGLSEKTLDDIAYKMRQLSTYRSGLDVSRSSKEISQVNDEYNRLKKRMDEVMQKNQQMIASNTALGRSWNYMKNRLAFYFTVGASTAFIKNLIEVRSQYEMNERALGILINSAERGTQIFNELSQMALVSPYTLIELSSAAKQLTAYDIAAKDVVNTTRRLADMAAAVGIPIERLTYALGQVKAYGYLNARDARMFANAGIPLVKNLSEYYTELEGRLVSTADIYDRIKKKQIGYEEVMSTISKMTDEGGKFFDFQAKMAETLKVQLANLTLAWNNMLNDMGEESQGVIVGGIGALKQMFLHWKDIEHVLTELVVTLGAYKAYQLVTTRLMGATSASLDAQVLAMKRNNAATLEKQALTRKLTVDELRQVAAQNQVTAADYRNALSGKNLTKQKALLLVALNKNNVQLKAAIVNMGLLTAQEAANVTTGRALAIVFKSIGISIRNAAMAMKVFMVSNWWMLALGGIYELYHAWDSYNEHVAEVNRSAAEHAKEAFENIKTYLEGDVINTLRETLKQGGKVSSDAEGQKAWDEMREKIELSSSASNVFIARLMQIDDINERLSAGFDYLNNIQRVAGVMQTLSDDAIKVSTTTLGGLFGEGLKDDLNDFVDAYQKYVNLNENLRQSGVGEEYFNEQKRALEEFRSEVEKTTESLYNIASREGFNINEQREFFERGISETAQAEQMGIKETRIYRIQAEQEYYAYAKAQLEEQLQYQQGEQKAATERRLQELQNEFGSNKAMQESFFTWLTEKQDHAVKNMLRGKTQEEIKQGDWLKGANGKWVEEMARKFSQEYGVSFDDLHRLVMNANTWSINIPVFFQTIGQPLTDVQRDYEARTGKKFSSNYLIKDAKSQVEILDILKKKQKEVAQEMETSRRAGGQYWEDNKQRYKEENDALIADIHAYNALTDAEEKANKKSGKGGSKKDPLLDALKQEISLVEKLQGDYDKLTKSGASQSEALEAIRGAYGKTIRLLNAQLGKYGLPQLDISQLVTGKDPHKALEHFKQTLDTLVSKGMLTLERSKELEAVVEKFTLSAKTYNLDMITKGLNNELGKLKDEYELAVELDANPELGGMFLDMFRIDTTDFPKTIDEYMQRVQNEFDKMREKRGFTEPLEIFKADDAKWESWGRNMGLVVDVLDKNGNVIDKNTDALDKLTPKFKEAQGVAKKWATDIVNNTKKLEYELAELNGKIAIKEKEQALLHERIEKEKNETTKHYLELTYQSNEKTIDELRAQALSLMPEYARVFNSIAEYSAGVSRRLQRDLMRVFDEAKYDSASGKWTLTGSDGKKTILNDAQYRKEREKLTKEMRKSQAPFKKIKEAFKPSDTNGVVDYAKGIELVSGEVQKLGSVASEVGNLAQIFGADEQTVEIINDVATSLNGVATAGQGISQIASGDYIGGAASVLSGITSIIGAWADNSDKQISAEIKESELAVKRLELTYIDLEQAVNRAYGASVAGAKRATLANKELQLAEIKRQIQLEKSRDSKHRDEGRIIELQKQYKELMYEIQNGTREIVDDLLGTDAGSFAEDLVQSMIDAFRRGEDYMEVFEKKFETMVDNMIMKVIVSRVVSSYIDRIWDSLDRRLTARSEKEAKDLAEIQNKRAQIEDMSDEQVARIAGHNTFGWGWAQIHQWAEEYRNMLEEEEKAAQAAYDAATEIDNNDINFLLSEVARISPELAEKLKETIGEWYHFGEDSQLSQLQQGLQSMSESTASAVEAYLNGISQQCYLQSDLLAQIRDAVVGFDMDVQTGTLSQILLQLQASFQTQNAIRSILEGWSSASGMSMRVELVQ